METDNVQYAKLNNLPGNNARVAGNRARGVVNHSSICAGREVICAGNISIWKGQMLHLDNGSGHYAPTREHLRKALKLLARDFGMPTGYLRVGNISANGAGYYTYTSFMAGSANPDWPDQLLSNDQTAIFTQRARQ